MNCTINSASHFSGLQAGMSPISLVQLTATVRKSTLDRSFILPILVLQRFPKTANTHVNRTRIQHRHYCPKCVGVSVRENELALDAS